MSSSVKFNHFARIACQVQPAADAAAQASAERLAERIRRDVRVDTGELRDSIAVSKGGEGYIVGSAADQALSEEFGTSRQSAHPTFAPAAEGERGGFVEGLVLELHKRLQ